MHRLSALATLLLAACGHAGPPPEPSDVDLAPARTAFHCGAAGADAEACRVLAAFAAAGPITAWPSPGEAQRWLGVDHCVQPTAGRDYDAYQLVYLKAGAGSAPLGTLAPARVLAYAGVFGSDQLRHDAPSARLAATAALAHGQPADAALAELPANADGAYRTLVHTLSGRTVGDGPVGTGVWFLRSDGAHLLLVGPTIQGGCASELFRIP